MATKRYDYVSKWLLFSLLLAATIAQPCTTEHVVKDKAIPWDPDSQDITILTYSMSGSAAKMGVNLYNHNGQDAGSVEIYFSSPMNYPDPRLLLGRCTSEALEFPVPLPVIEDTWRISYHHEYTQYSTIMIYCNDVQVLNLVLSEVCDNTDWIQIWEQTKPTQIQFSDSDNASDDYCLEGKIGQCTGLGLNWNNLKTDVTFPVVHGTIVTVTCDPGYELEGRNTVTCDQDTTLAGQDHPTCKKQECTRPTFEREGWPGIVSLQEFPVGIGTVITLRCEKKGRYVLFGDKLITCQQGDSLHRQHAHIKPNCKKLGKNVSPYLWSEITAR